MLVEGFALIVENLIETVPSDLVPYHGKIFSSHDDVYEFYKSFAKAWGFSVRRQRTIEKESDSNGTTRRYYVCHRVGHLTNKYSHMSIAKVMDSDISYWRAVTFDNYNHDVLQLQEVRFLPVYCIGICVSDMMRLFEIEISLKPRELPFMDKDIYNFVCALNHLNRDNDAHILLTKCKQMKNRDKDFKYDFIIGEDNRLEHIIWSHGSCSRAHEIFGDVVVGINNHGDTCLFGSILLRDERVQSFSWAMKVCDLLQILSFEFFDILTNDVCLSMLIYF
ncbi:hypothetical protein AMTRI_Chr09g37620 [Amborella trichopoda]